MLAATPAFAISGQAPPAAGFAARAIVMLIDNRGDLCTATALTRDLVLTAAHCVVIPATYRVRVFQNGAMADVDKIRRHPGFNMANYKASRATADVALIKLKSPLPDIVVPATLAPPARLGGSATLMTLVCGAMVTPRSCGVVVSIGRFFAFCSKGTFRRGK